MKGVGPDLTRTLFSVVPLDSPFILLWGEWRLKKDKCPSGSSWGMLLLYLPVQWGGFAWWQLHLTCLLIVWEEDPPEQLRYFAFWLPFIIYFHEPVSEMSKPPRTLTGTLNYLSTCASFRLTNLCLPRWELLFTMIFLMPTQHLNKWILDMAQVLTVVLILSMLLVFFKSLFTVWQFFHSSQIELSFSSENW